MFCSNCGATLTPGTSSCPACGKESSVPGATPSNRGEPSLASIAGAGGFSRFINFETMITPIIIKWLFIIGAVIIILGSLFVMSRGEIGFFFSGLIGGTIGLIWFRVMCEMMVLFFSIHRELKDMRKKL
ncbi:MAG: DUF4282 domain-containing protein [Defluviitaleaceae bacterium]|nr:DUF4282 domain-containing protein [Defluviitaleaceae bacterium]